MKDLTISNIERQNVLNNRFAVSKVQEHLDIEGMLFEGEYRFTKKMVADFYEVEERTIERYLEKHSDELSANGYILCKGKHLKELKLQFAPVINVGSKTTQLGLFNFRSFLDMGMLLTESEKAKKVRSLILDFVIQEYHSICHTSVTPGIACLSASFRQAPRIFNRRLSNRCPTQRGLSMQDRSFQSVRNVLYWAKSKNGMESRRRRTWSSCMTAAFIWWAASKSYPRRKRIGSPC